MKVVLPAERHSSEGVFALSKRRVYFSKMNMAKYISHLDLLRCFERSIMRSGLPVEYSQGFNPHQKMTFSLPLPVGVTSECETVDICFEDGKVIDEEITEALNLNLPPDIRVIKTGEVLAKASDIVRAEYEVILYSDEKIDEKVVKDFFSQSEVIVMKKTKKKVDKPVNIFEYLKAWEILSADDKTMKLRLCLDAGGERNLKPDVVVGELCKFLGNVSPDDADIHRKQVFSRKENSDEIEIFE